MENGLCDCAIGLFPPTLPPSFFPTALDFTAQLQLNFFKEWKCLKVLCPNKHYKNGWLYLGETPSRAPTEGKAQGQQLPVVFWLSPKGWMSLCPALIQPHMEKTSGRETCCSRKCWGCASGTEIYLGMGVTWRGASALLILCLRGVKNSIGEGGLKFFDVGVKRILSQEQNIGQLLTFPATVSFSTV